MRKGLWFDLPDIESFLAIQKKFISVIKQLGFTGIGIPLKSRFGRRDVDKLQDFVNSCQQEDLEVWAWMVCLADTSHEKEYGKLYSKDLQGKVIDHWICPNKARNPKFSIPYKGRDITYLGYLTELIKEVSDFPLFGLNLQLLRYPGLKSCWCEECKKEFGTQHLNLSDPETLDNWVAKRSNAIEDLLKALVAPIRSRMEISINLFLEFSCFGRLGQKTLLGIDADKIKNYCSSVCVCLDELGIMMGKNIDEIQAFLTYMNRHIFPVEIQIMGITSRSDFLYILQTLEKIKFPYFFIIPDPISVLDWKA